jgi:hypothetical protein
VWTFARLRGSTARRAAGVNKQGPIAGWELNDER